MVLRHYYAVGGSENSRGVDKAGNCGDKLRDKLPLKGSQLLNGTFPARLRSKQM